MKKVTVEITDDLQVKLDYDGFQGATCIEDFEELEKLLSALGVKLDERDTQKKRDFYVRAGSSLKTR